MDLPGKYTTQKFHTQREMLNEVCNYYILFGQGRCIPSLPNSYNEITKYYTINIWSPYRATPNGEAYVTADISKRAGRINNAHKTR